MQKEIIGLWAEDRESLVAGDHANVIKANGGPFLHIALPCGHVREWATADLVPAKSVRCYCLELPDAETHWFIKYGKAKVFSIQLSAGPMGHRIIGDMEDGKTLSLYILGDFKNVEWVAEALNRAITDEEEAFRRGG